VIGYTGSVLFPIFFFGTFGLIVGSFLNVIILRFGERSVGGRSACPQCGKTLAWYDLIPVFSYIALLGKCRYCHAGISIQYPLVEAATAAVFVIVGSAGLPWIATLCALVIASLLICIFVYDLRHKLIPDLWVWAFCISACAYAIFNFQFSIFNLLAGPIAALPILFLWALSYPFTKRFGEWMGFGDVKLALGMGWLLPLPTPLGLPLGLVAVFLAFIIGAIISVCILLPLPFYMKWVQALGGRARAARLAFFGPVGERDNHNGANGINLPTEEPMSDHANLDAGYTMKSEVPFGPFLIASTLLVWVATLYDISIPFIV